MSDDVKNTDRPERPVWTPEASTDYVDQFVQGAPEEPAADADGPAAADPDAPLKDRVIAQLQTIYDPEIPVNIYELGLIYNVDVTEAGDVVVTMTLTTPHCPVAETMPGEVEMRVSDVPGVTSAEVNLVWEPAWDMTKMSDEARLELGLL